ncbi:MAG TPA: diguanylate cyclase [Methylocella sp.]|nr:diguanylate cyclase [Methylocella sp.]
MKRLVNLPFEPDAVSEDIAWKLVDTLFRQTTSLISGASVFMVLGIVGFVGTGSLWYLGGLAYTFCVFLWRFGQTRIYARSRDSATPVAWAWRNIRSGWATAAGWGAWSAVVLFEPEQSIVIMVIGMHAGLVGGGAVRNSSVRAVATGQIILASTPLFFACALSSNSYLHVYAGIVALHLVAALTIIASLHKQTLQLLLREKDKSDLVERLAIANEDLELMNQQLESLAAIDALTNVANRRTFDLRSAQEWSRLTREQTPLSMLMLDVDYFKAFNDSYGHQEGDVCLQNVAAAICSAVRRPGDLVARYGGEEFVVVLPGTFLNDAVLIAEQISAALRTLALPHAISPFGYVTVSIGAACMIPQQGLTIDELMAMTDSALYAAKRSGRNCVQAAGVPITRAASGTIVPMPVHCLTA